ncbi:flagellar biosynthetic protein FliP [Buchnera aphidicola (Thelaxes californica)]|uniref:Flagellar biosynthetic protein FliP n=1 Tax=Buchnera aphidicola (Thelaxes californica) TaxID=1315998 RepID=A0A4D6YBY5_9GAMM|nr:flagellar type III secretion system pore protein FliP [Buchnera aphidicola]QCI26622.1 flagellar biosynthetic protein FliP [Buchnera aphidicola (Thelaxes californica)]
MQYQYIVMLLTLLLFPLWSFASPIDVINEFLQGKSQLGSSYFPLELLIFLSSLSFIPAFILMMTSFTRIIIVFGLLRNALGTPYSPPNQILIGLSLFLTFFIMNPVFEQAYQESYIPYSQNKIDMIEAVDKAIYPFRNFMLKQIKDSDLILFANLSKITVLKDRDSVPMKIILPAFMTSEIKTGFQIGFSIFLPFLIIDLLVASVLMSLGMMMVPPSTVSLPFKLMFFILSDGWNLLIRSLFYSFHT